jgi:hypothetical protein
MTTFSYRIAKRRTYINFDGRFFFTDNNYNNRTFYPISKQEVEQLVPTSYGWEQGQAESLEGAYDQIIERADKERAERIAANEAIELERQRKIQQLLSSQPIPATVENVRLVAAYLNTINWGAWNLPKMTIGYKAHQYDCDGKLATTIVLDEPISDPDYDIYNERKFVVGAPMGHLSKYQHLRS